ncbi:MAG TPA: AMP-binding protein, partial [Solirubrobacteraceae bacterium]|nr:AMP-binding protein [Solirubrobacteraceae bacterium]
MNPNALPERPLLGERVRAHAAARPDAAAVVEVGVSGERAWTWAQLTAAVDTARAELTALGVGPGDTVALQLQNRLEFVALSVAIVEAGATAMPLMPIFRERELAFMLELAAPRVLYVPDRFRGHDHLAMARRLAAELPSLQHVVSLPDAERVPTWCTSATSVGQAYGASPTATRLPAAPDHERPDQIVDLLFTSGTSGEPKGALHRHDRLMAATARHVSHFGLSADDVIFCPAP